MSETLAEAAAEADALAQRGDERALAELRSRWDDELEAAVRDGDYRTRAQGYRAVGQFRFRQKLELLRRGLEDESPAARGAAIISLELLSREHPGAVNGMRPLLHRLLNDDPNSAVRRLAAAGDDRAARGHRRRRAAGRGRARCGAQGRGRAD